jgi:ABC-type uncharacterized transport system substrate-binding protein
MKRLAITIDFLKSGFFALLFMLAGASGAPAIAHPHAWIDLRSTVVLDADGHVIAIEQQWLFDQFYTLFITEALSDAASARAEELKALARKNLQNLRTYDYFTEVRSGGAKVALGTVSELESELRAGRLWMRFVVPLATPIDPTERALAFAVFDPTYYIEILHLKDDIVAFRGAGIGSCLGRIVPPNPTTEAVILAQAMDRDATPDASLGSVFAEWVEITCR